MTVDPYRALIAAGIVIMVGVFIFVIRNRKTMREKMVESHE